MIVDTVIIGGGPAGLASAISASKSGIKRVWLFERNPELGGILPQCIHDGFGISIFGDRLTGPEYARRYIEEIKKTDVVVKLNSMVLEIDPEKRVIAVNPYDGVLDIEAKTLILAMGCREKTRSQILIPGDRPAGIYTAGVAQRLVNVEGVMPGKKIVILGSGDVGLIMARRFVLEGAEVVGVYEIMPIPGGSTRNIVQCLEDFNIPLHLSHTVIDIKGKERVEGVTVARVDSQMKPIAGTEQYVPCDTVILSVGLIPENELSEMAGLEMDPLTGGPMVDETMQTSIPGIFAVGNVAYVHDLVDDVSLEGELAGRMAARYLSGQLKERKHPIWIERGRNVRYAIPQMIRYQNLDEKLILRLRVTEVERDVRVRLLSGEQEILVRRERIVMPSQMLSVGISRDLLDEFYGNSLRIEVQKDEEHT